MREHCQCGAEAKQDVFRACAGFATPAGGERPRTQLAGVAEASRNFSVSCSRVLM
jgi:hypothetical protein